MYKKVKDVYIKYLCCIRENNGYRVISCNTYIDGHEYSYPYLQMTMNNNINGTDKYIFYEDKKMQNGSTFVEYITSQYNITGIEFRTLLYPMNYSIIGDKFNIENDEVNYLRYGEYTTNMITVPYVSYQNNNQVYLDNFGWNMLIKIEDNFNYYTTRDPKEYYSKTFYSYNRYITKDNSIIREEILSSLYNRNIWTSRLPYNNKKNKQYTGIFGKKKYGTNIPLTYEQACKLYKGHNTSGRDMNIIVNRAIFDFIAYPFYRFGFSKVDIKTLLQWYKYYDNEVLLHELLDNCRRDPTYIFPIVSITKKDNIKTKYVRLIKKLIGINMTYEQENTLKNLYKMYKHMSSTGSTYIEGKYLNMFDINIESLSRHIIRVGNNYYFRSIQKREELLRTRLHELINGHRLSIVYGAAGTGKTHNLLERIRGYDDRSNTYILSPTGKAANVVRRRIEEVNKTLNHIIKIEQWFVESHISTIHSFMYKIHNIEKINMKDGIYMNSQEEYNIIIDEFSMVSMDVLLILLDALKSYNVSYIFMGDYNQLPPIDIGHVFLSMKESGLLDCTYISKELKVNYRVSNTSNANKYIDTLLENGDVLVNNTDIAIPERFTITDLQDPNGIIIKKLYLAYSNKRCREISNLLRPNELIHNGRKFLSINRDIDTCMKSYSTIDSYNGEHSTTFYEGDLIMLKKNIEVTYDTKNNKTIRLFNGMYGVINSIMNKGNNKYSINVCIFDAMHEYHDSNTSLYNIWVNKNRDSNIRINIQDEDIKKLYSKITNLEFETYSNKYITEDEDNETRGKDILLIDDLILGYCITVHSSQGSQARNVYIDIPQYIDISKNWLYTAISRTQENVYFNMSGRINDKGYHETKSNICHSTRYKYETIVTILTNIVSELMNEELDENYTYLLVLLTQYPFFITNILNSIDGNIKEYIDRVIRHITSTLNYTIDDLDLDNIIDIISHYNVMWEE